MLHDAIVRLRWEIKKGKFKIKYMSISCFREYFISPLEYVENTNHYSGVEVFQFVDNYDTACEYIDNDFDKNFEEHISKNGIKSGNNEIDEICDFRDNMYPNCYFFICLDESDLTFMEKQIFKVELLDLLDLDDDEKEELYNDSFENNCMLIKLTKKLRNLQKYPISG